MVVVDFGGCQLKHKTRKERLRTVAANFLAAPEQSLPKQNENGGDLKAAYRLFDRPEATFQAVASEHWKRTRQTQPGRYLLISDTTDINYNSRKATKGLGFIGNGGSRGVQIHSCLVYDSGRELIVGQGGAIVHYRKRAPKDETRAQRLKRVRESNLWGDLVDQVGPAPEGSQWIHVFDRGGDHFEALCHIQLTGADWVVRAAKLNRNVFNQNGEKVSLHVACEETTHLGGYTLDLRSRPGVAARTAELEVSATTITMPHPHHKTKWIKECGIKSLTMNVVIVQEVNAPKGVKPIRWVLLTSLPVRHFKDAWQVIEDYENRWLIEIYQAKYVSRTSLYRLAA